MMQIAPISETGWRGPAKPAEYGEPVDWSSEEVASGTYSEFVLIEDDGTETIRPLVVPAPIYHALTFLPVTLRITVHKQ